MPLPTNLQLLDYGIFGSPCLPQSKTNIDLDTLNYGTYAQQFTANNINIVLYEPLPTNLQLLGYTMYGSPLLPQSKTNIDLGGLGYGIYAKQFAGNNLVLYEPLPTNLQLLDFYFNGDILLPQAKASINLNTMDYASYSEVYVANNIAPATTGKIAKIIGVALASISKVTTVLKSALSKVSGISK